MDPLCDLAVGLLLDESSISGFFSEFGYLGPFTILVLCGFGLPIPEEVTMLGSGFLLSQGRVEALPIIVTCFAATLIGDSVPFWLGRIWGRRALRVRSVRRALNPARIRAMERRFRQNGARAVLVCRFIPGLRLPAWFTAGSLGMRYPKFLALDALGAAVMTPTFIFLGRASGEKIAELEKTVEDLTQILGFIAVSLAAMGVIRFLVSRRLPGTPPAPAGDRASDRNGASPVERRSAPGSTPAGAASPSGAPPQAARPWPPLPAPVDEPELEDGDRP